MGKTLCNAIKNKVVSSCSIIRSHKLKFGLHLAKCVKDKEWEVLLVSKKMFAGEK